MRARGRVRARWRVRARGRSVAPQMLLTGLAPPAHSGPADTVIATGETEIYRRGRGWRGGVGKLDPGRHYYRCISSVTPRTHPVTFRQRARQQYFFRSQRETPLIRDYFNRGRSTSSTSLIAKVESGK